MPLWQSKVALCEIKQLKSSANRGECDCTSTDGVDCCKIFDVVVFVLSLIAQEAWHAMAMTRSGAKQQQQHPSALHSHRSTSPVDATTNERLKPRTCLPLSKTAMTLSPMYSRHCQHIALFMST